MINAGSSGNSRFFLLLMSVMVMLVPLFVLSFFARPAADDFMWAASHRDTSFWDMQKDYYLNWQGRYFSTPLLSVLAYLSVSSAGYHWHAIVLMILTAGSFYFFVTSFLRKISTADTGLSIRLLISLVLFLLYTYSLPSVAQAYYWLSGAVTYQVPVVAMVILGGLLIGDRPVRNQVLHGSGMLFLVFIIAGSNELSAILLLLFMPLAGKRFRWLQVSIVVLVAMAIFSPGSWKRSQLMGEKDIAKVLASIFYWSINLVLGIIREPLYWTSLLVSFISGYLFGTRKPLPPKIYNAVPFGAVVILLLPVVSLAPILWGSNGSIPPRMLNVLVMPMIFVSLCGAYFYGCWFHGDRIKEAMLIQLPSFFWWIIAVMPLASGQVPRIYENLLQGYVYGKVFSDREKNFSEAAAKGGTIQFVPYDSAAKQVLAQHPFIDLVLFREKVERLPDIIAWYDDYEPRDRQGFIKLYYKRKSEGSDPVN
jgi:hypothetical protein